MEEALLLISGIALLMIVVLTPLTESLVKGILCTIYFIVGISITVFIVALPTLVYKFVESL